MASPPRLVKTRPTGHGRARGLVSGRVSGGRIDAGTFAPPSDLADVVEALWYGQWDLRGQPPHISQLLSDPCVHIVFEGSGGRVDARIVGVWTQLWQRELAEVGQVRGVKLRPGAVRAFLGAPAHTLTNQLTPLSDHVEGDVEELAASILGPDDPESGLDALGAWLLALRRDQEWEDVSLAVALLERIAADGEITTVDAFSKVSGMSPRALQRLFRTHVGGSPKWAIRRARLQEVALRIEQGQAHSLADLAAELGYTDQAHLARDFKNAVGQSPSTFREAVWR